MTLLEWLACHVTADELEDALLSYGGNSHYLPMLKSLHRASRNLKMTELRRTGMTYAALGERFDLDESSVRKIVDRKCRVSKKRSGSAPDAENWRNAP